MENDPEPYADIVEEACLNSWQWDAYFEHPRDAYLVRLARLAGIEGGLVPKLRDRLSTDLDGRSRAQVLKVLARLARDGCSDAWEALIACASADRELRESALDVIVLVGAQGMAWVLAYGAERYAGEDATFHANWDWERVVILDGEEAARGVLECAPPAVRQLFDAKLGVDWAQARSSAARPPAPENLEEFAQRFARETKRYPLRRLAREFARVCSEADRVVLWEMLLAERHPDRLMALGKSLRHWPCPIEPTPFVHRALRTRSGKAVEAFVVALSSTTHDAVRALAWRLLERPLPNDDAAELLAANPSDDDFARLPSVLERASRLEPGLLHSFGLSLLSAVEARRTKAWGASLRWLYETTPCSHCRGFTSAHMARLGLIDSALAKEMAFDAEPDIRARVTTM